MTTFLGRLPVGLVLAVGAVVVGGSLAVAPSLAGSLALVAASMLGLTLLVRKLCDWPEHQLSRRIGRWTAGAFAGHLAVGLIISSSARLTTYFGGDADQYHFGALGIVAHWVSGLPMPTLPVGKEGFYYLLAGIYWVLGPSRLPGLIVNAALAAALVPVMSALTYELFGSRPARFVPVLVTLLPGFVLWPSQLLREAGIYFFIAIALLAATRLSRRMRLGPILVMGGALALLSTWRSYIALMVAAGLIVALVGATRGLAGVGAGIGGVMAAAALIVGLGLGYSGLQATTQTDLAQVNNVRLDSATGAASGYLSDADVSDSRRALSYLPVAFPYLAVGPFPWQLASGRQFFGAPDAAAWWLLLPSLLTGIRIGWRRERRRVLVLIAPALAVAMVTALIVANFGTMVRARMQVIIILVPLVALGWSERHRSSVGDGRSAQADEASIVGS